MKPTATFVAAPRARQPIAWVCAALLLALAARTGAEEDAATSIAFTQDFTGLCVSRNGVQFLVRNTHPTRRVRVWLDRIYMGTGDRSRSDLAPSAEPEPLGCSRSLTGPQEWRVVRAVFID